MSCKSPLGTMTVILMVGSTVMAGVGQRPDEEARDAKLSYDVSANVGAFTLSQSLIDEIVYDRKGLRVGTLDDIVIDPYTGMATTLVVMPHAALSQTGRMLIPFRLVAPIKQLELRVKADVAAIDDGPSIGRGVDARPYRRQLAKVPYEYYGVQPSWAEIRAGEGQRVDDEDVFLFGKSLRGLPVRDGTGDEVGVIDEIAISVENGKVAYVVLSVPGELGPESRRRYAVPLGAFVVQPGARVWVLEAPGEVLGSVTALQRGPLPAQLSLKWSKYVESRYGNGMLDGVQRGVARPKRAEFDSPRTGAPDASQQN